MPSSVSVFTTTNGGKPVWCAQYAYYDAAGKRRYVRGYAPLDLGDTLGPTTARNRLEASIERRLTNPRLTRDTPSSPLLATFVPVWLEHYSPQELGEETRRKYRRDLERHVLPHVNKRLNLISRDECRNLFNKTLMSDEVGVAARRNAFKALRTCLNWAVTEGILDRSPLDGMKIGTEKPAVRKVDRTAIDFRVMMARELLDWLADETNDHHDHFPRTLMMFLGLRRAELLGLEWTDVRNLTRTDKPATLYVHQQLKRHEDGSGWYLHDQTKNKEDREVPLPELWRKALLAEKAKKRAAAEPWARKLVWIRSNGRHTDYNTHYNSWNTILTEFMTQRWKLTRPLNEREQWRPHYNRHIAASLMGASDIPMQIAQQILGHMDETTTLYYTHGMRESRTLATASLEKALTITLD